MTPVVGLASAMLQKALGSPRSHTHQSCSVNGDDSLNQVGKKAIATGALAPRNSEGPCDLATVWRLRSGFETLARFLVVVWIGFSSVG